MVRCLLLLRRLLFNLLREKVWEGPAVMIAPANELMWYQQTIAYLLRPTQLNRAPSHNQKNTVTGSKRAAMFL